MAASFFPFDRVRDGQRLFLGDAADALGSGRFLLAHAPTGMGKTAVGLAAALEAAAGRATVLFLTSKTSQHRMAVDTLQKIRDRGREITAVDVVAKQAMCLRTDAPPNAAAFEGFCSSLVRTQSCVFYRQESRSVAKALAREVLHVQDLERGCRAFGVCPHKAALEAARDCDVVVCDFNYLFSDVRDAVLGRIGLDLKEVIAVVDEAHNLPDRIRSQASGDLRPALLERAKREAMAVDRRVARTLLRFAQVLREALPREEAEVRPEFLGEALATGTGESPVELATVLEVLGGELTPRGSGAAVLQVAAFLKGWGRKGMARVARGGEDPRLSLRLLDPSVVAAPVFAQLRAGILMSGTLHPVEMYADLLGVPGARRVIRSYPSPFDPARRLLLASRRHTSAYAQRGPALYRGIAATIAETCASFRGNAAAFLPSYGFTANVTDALRDRTDRAVLSENQAWTKADRDAALRWLEDHADPGGIVLGVLGGGLSEGVDYRDNLLRCVFLVGLPLTPPTVEAKALQRYLSGKFGSEKGFEYAVLAPASSKLLQAAGRPIRAESDRAAIVLLESRLLEPRYRRLFPEDFAYRESQGLAEEVGAFLAEPTEPEMVKTPALDGPAC